MEPDNSSAAVAAVATLVDAALEVPTAPCACRAVWSEDSSSVTEVSFSAVVVMLTAGENFFDVVAEFD